MNLLRKYIKKSISEVLCLTFKELTRILYMNSERYSEMRLCRSSHWKFDSLVSVDRTHSSRTELELCFSSKLSLWDILCVCLRRLFLWVMTCYAVFISVVFLEYSSLNFFWILILLDKYFSTKIWLSFEFVRNISIVSAAREEKFWLNPLTSK